MNITPAIFCYFTLLKSFTVTEMYVQSCDSVFLCCIDIKTEINLDITKYIYQITFRRANANGRDILFFN